LFLPLIAITNTTERFLGNQTIDSRDYAGHRKEEMSDAPLISIRNLHASAGETPILRGIDLELRAGEIHAVMGPNGSGKSTLSNVLVGKPGYEVTEGEILFRGENLLEMNPETRAREGVFLAFQYPVEIPGVANNYFLRTAVNAVREHRGLDELDAIDFLTFLKEKMKLVEMPEDMMSRSINEGFSGGEKKRNEILQMLLLEPSFCILDETDSGLDIDALRVVAGGVNQMRSPDRSMLIITHYQRLLDYIVPDHVHVLSNGRIVRSGDKSLAFELEAKGYGWVDELQGEEAAGRGAGS
jgi:Fe-S cluster assembly ATP-binding protein